MSQQKWYDSFDEHWKWGTYVAAYSKHYNRIDIAKHTDNLGVKSKATIYLRKTPIIQIHAYSTKDLKELTIIIGRLKHYFVIK